MTGDTSADPLAALLPRPVGQATVDWLSSYGSTHTRAAYQRDLRVWLGFCAAGGMDPLTATWADVEAWIKDMREAPTRLGAPPADATITRRVASVASWYDYLLDVGLADHTPVHRRGRPRIDTSTSTAVLGRSEAGALVKAAASEPPRGRAILLVLLYTGMRVGELAGLNVASYGHDADHATLLVGGRGGRTRVAALPVPAADAVEAYLAGRAAELGLPAPAGLDPDLPLITSAEGGRLTDRSVGRLLRRVAKRAGIASHRDLSTSSLRRADLARPSVRGATRAAVW